MYCLKCGLSKLIKDKSNQIMFQQDQDIILIEHYTCPECSSNYIKTQRSKIYSEQLKEVTSDAEL